MFCELIRITSKERRTYVQAIIQKHEAKKLGFACNNILAHICPSILHDANC